MVFARDEFHERSVKGVGNGAGRNKAAGYVGMTTGAAAVTGPGLTTRAKGNQIGQFLFGTTNP